MNQFFAKLTHVFFMAPWVVACVCLTSGRLASQPSVTPRTVSVECRMPGCNWEGPSMEAYKEHYRQVHQSGTASSVGSGNLQRISTEAMTQGLLHGNGGMFVTGFMGSVLDGLLSAPSKSPEEIAREQEAARIARERAEEEERLAEQRRIEEEQRRAKEWHDKKESLIGSFHGIPGPEQLDSGPKVSNAELQSGAKKIEESTVDESFKATTDDPDSAPSTKP